MRLYLRWIQLSILVLLVLASCNRQDILPAEAPEVASPLANHSTTDRVQQLLEDNSTGGTIGLYLKEVGGSVLANLNESFQFEPASSIKALIHFHAMRQVQDGAMIGGQTVTVDTLIPWMARNDKFNNGNYIPGGSDCAATNTIQMNTALLDPTLRWTMEDSDNATTQGLRDFFGDAAIDVTRLAFGMTNSVLDHSIGCGAEAVANPNRLTLVDAGKMYEAVATGYLNDEHRQLAYSVMPTGAGTLASIAEDEANLLGLSEAKLSDFNAQRQSARKGGSYGLSKGSYRSQAGWVELPFKNAQCEVEPRGYVYGVFIHEADTAAASSVIASISLELFREQIRSALESWAACDDYADLAILDWNLAALDNTGIQDFLVGQAFNFEMPKVLRNYGDTVYGVYDTPVDATVTVSIEIPAGIRGSIKDGNITIWGVGPTTISRDVAVPGLEVGVDREVVETFGLECLEPGQYTIVLRNEIWADDEHILDPDPSNNVVEVQHVIECVLPVQINIRPGNAQNFVNHNSNQRVPIAILTTEAGEYDLPLDFDATTVDHATVRFGTAEILNAGEGTAASPDRDFIRDSFEMDDKSKDSDLDMVLLFSVPGSGIDDQTSAACLVGSYLGEDASPYTFFGCDAVRITGPGS